MRKAIVFFLLGYCAINCCPIGTAYASGFSNRPDHANIDSLASLQDVKERVIIYLLGESGEGLYRQKVVDENDKWVESILHQKFISLIWEESEALTMNVKIMRSAMDLRRMAIVFRTTGSKYEQSPELKQRIIAGMENVLEHFAPATPRPGNWHPWLISIPNYFGATTLLMEPFISPEILTHVKKALRYQLTDKLVLTGTNAAWESRNHIYLALLDSDLNRLKRAADYVFSTVRYGPENGVREDYCYLYHGNIPYAGAYGSGFVQTIAEFIYVFDGTPFAISQVHLDLVVNFLLEHSRWFITAEQIDLHVRGRVFKNHGNWDQLLESFVVLAHTNDPRSKELANTALMMLKANPNVDLNLTCAGFADGIKASGGEMPGGFRYWPTGEIGVFKQPSFHIGYRQFSTRVQDYEYLNREDGGEGEEGWNLPYGFTNILREDGFGSWYSKEGSQAMYPEIDMEHLPGTTSRIGGNPINPRFRPDPNRPTKSTTGFSLNFGKSHFAGGAGWKDGGVAGFILQPAYGEYLAKKSVHFFPMGFWALGSGIVSTTTSPEMANKPIHTTVLQWVSSKQEPELTLPDSSLVLAKNNVSTIDNVQWFWIKDENVAVIFNEPTKVFFRLKGKVITAWLDHGTKPSAARYAYAVLPKTSLSVAKCFADELPFRPVRYDENVHAVKEKEGQSEGLVFFAPDSCLGLKTDSPVIVYRKGKDKGGVYTIQDPLHQSGKIKISVEKFAGQITLPDSEVNVTQLSPGKTGIELLPVMGRVYRLGYGNYGQSVYKEPRKDLEMSSYRDFKIEATSDAEKTILTVHLPEEAVRDGYQLSVHFSKSQRLHDFTEADVIDRPTRNTVRYRWNRATATGPSVFSDYWKVKHGNFKVYLVSQLIELDASFTVPNFDK